jgi:hypothetical protein
MAWIDDESRWESGETGFGVGRTLYWLTTTIAAIIVVFAVADFFISWAQGAPSGFLPSWRRRWCG